MEYPIQVKYDVIYDAYTAWKRLSNLPDLFAADFETASKFTQKEKEILKWRYDNEKDEEKRRIYLQQYLSNGFSHPSLSCITHLSIAWSNRDSFVIICNKQQLQYLVCDFLVTTDKKQIWHNCTFDFKHILYNTGKIPKNYVDTRLLAKCLLNDADGFKSNVGLKNLMGYAYGAWSVAKDDLFNLDSMYDEKLLHYAAIDSCATYKLYQDIQEDLNKWQI